METVKRTTVVGVFDDPDRARDAIQELKDAGFEPQDIGILMKDRQRAKDMANETGSHAGEGAGTGLVAGGILGGLAGWLVGIGALAIPGIGPFIAAGAFGTALAGAGIGAGVGAIAGALVGMGIPKEEADWYEGEVRRGQTLVTVKADGRYGEAHTILGRHGAYDIENRYAGTSSTIGAGTAPGEPIPSGGNSGSINPTTNRWGDRTQEIDQEYEATRSGYGSGFETEGSSDTGMTTTSPFGAGPWEKVMPGYHDRWQQTYGGTGRRWEDYEPAYRYGWEMSNRPEYTGRGWSEAESDLRSGWENRYPDRPWDRFADAVREAWEGVKRQGSRAA